MHFKGSVIPSQRCSGKYIRPILLTWLLACTSANAADVSLKIADISAADFSARDLTLILPENGSADLHIGELRIQQRSLRKQHLHCERFTLSTTSMRCLHGTLDQFPGMLLEFSHDFDTANWQISAQLHGLNSKSFAAFLPHALPQLTQGILGGTLRMSGNASGANTLNVDMQLAEIGFSDSSGQHAAENLRGTLKLNATRKLAAWNWQTEMVWHSGELFWQPLYLSGGGHSLSASGSYDEMHFKLEQATVDLPEVGRAQLAALWDSKQERLLEASVQSDQLALKKLFSDYARPFLDKSALAESNLYGHASVDWHYRDGATQTLRLTLRDAGIADAAQRFALLGVNSAIDWQADAPGSANITFAGGALLGAPLGSGRWTVQMHGMEFGVTQATLPVFDGQLELGDFKLHLKDAVWHWQFAATLSRISMEQLSRTAGWPKMQGLLAGHIPTVTYDGNAINMDGTLLFSVFDGTVVATQLKLVDPFGRAPHLSGNLNMRALDLGLLTSTFSFGNMQGRIDVDVNNLELQNWRPARFEARIASSAGNYPKKISQRAVQNISALGGAGAAAAIQRSYLRFFENFGYDRIGWRCVLRNGVCAMGGMDSNNSGTYTIIKGGGIPAITVMGYNRSVSWDELITRLKRVTQSNVQAVVK